MEAAIAASITPLATTPSDPSDPSSGNFGSSEITMCESFPVEYRIISGANATMYGINFDLLIPNAGSGLAYVPNSATIEVEGIDVVDTPRAIDAAGEAALVAATSATNNILLSDLDDTNFGSNQGLKGAGNDPTQNEVIIRFLMQATCNFTSGKRVRVKTFGESACGDIASGNGEQISSSPLPLTGLTIPFTVPFASSWSPDNTFNGCTTSVLNKYKMDMVSFP